MKTPVAIVIGAAHGTGRKLTHYPGARRLAREDDQWEDVAVAQTPHHRKSTEAIELAASDFASKTLTRLTKLGRGERAARLAAFKEIVERVESRAIATKRPETRTNRATTRVLLTLDRD